MPQCYSYDLRMKVIKALDDGMKKTEVSKIFNISRNTINLWLMRRKESGDYRAKNGYQQGYNPKINDLEEFQEFVEKHSSQTQKEMAESWGEKISDKTIGKALKKIGFTRKKNLWVSRKV
jgi:transposase